MPVRAASTAIPRFTPSLAWRTASVRCVRKRVGRLMRQGGLEGVNWHRNHRPGGRCVLHPRFSDLVARDCSTDVTIHLTVANITQHPPAEGWLHPAMVLDVLPRYVIGWSSASRITGYLVVPALEMAATNREPESA